MEGRKAELLQRIESDREVQLDFFRRYRSSPFCTCASCAMSSTAG
jgi:hypothetical protein